ncbi:citryl-CoA lyase [Candidatus Microgenomates bacterium]|nr:citryl-CoA lyase [Candidatus Microgenomates bacterium]
MNNWKTKIAGQVNGKLVVRGHELTKLIEEVGFVPAIWLVLLGELPNEKQERMLNALLVASLEHGVAPPSTTVARIVASTGNSVNTAVAAGVSAIGEHHGGAGEKAAQLFKQAFASESDAGKAAKALVDEVIKRGERMPGYGHAIYDVDPRTQTLLKIAKKEGFYGTYVELALAVERELQIRTGKKLPLNIDGIIAALLLELGFDPKLGKGIFIIGRVPGLVAHIFEEQTEEKPYRRLSEEEIAYEGKK